MRAKFCAVLAALIIAFCAIFAVACKNNTTPPDDSGNSSGSNPSAPTELTVEQFKKKAEKFMSLENYIINLKACEITVNVSTKADNNKVEYSFNLKFDPTVLENTKFSVNFADDSTKINVIVADQVLYVDKTENGKTERDSIENFDNNLADVIAELIKSAGEGSSLDVANSDSFAGLDFLPVDEIEGAIKYFENYLKITYTSLETSNLYVLKLDYPGGEYEGQKIDAFKCTLNLQVKNNKIVYADIDYSDSSNKLTGTFTEHAVDIKPSDPQLYNGTMLDKFEEIYRNRDMDESEFYGTWISEDCTIVIEQNKIEITMGDEMIAYEFYLSYGPFIVMSDAAYALMFNDGALTLISLPRLETIATLTKSN